MLFSRVTDPENFMLVGMPPKDLIDVVATAWREAGLDVNECFRRATRVTNEWILWLALPIKRLMLLNASRPNGYPSKLYHINSARYASASTLNRSWPPS